MRKAIAAVMLAILVLGATACGRPSGEGSDGLKTVKVGLIGARSGASAALGQYLDAAVAAFRHMNETGGLGGYRFEVELRDDETNPTKAAELTRELIYKEQVVAIIGPTNTSNAVVMVPIVTEARVPLIVPVATGTQIVENSFAEAKGDPSWVFSVTVTDDVQAERMARYAKEHGLTRPAILHDDTAYGNDGAQQLTKALAAVGITPVAVISHNMSSPDLTPFVLKAREAGADSLMLWSLGHDQAQAAKARAKLGWDVPLIGCTSLQTSNFRSLAGPAAEGGLSIWPKGHVRINPNSNAVPPRIQQAYDIYFKYYGGDAKTIPLDTWGSGAFVYDAAMIVAQAVAAVGPDREKIRDYIETQPLTNLASRDEIRFSREKHTVYTADDLTMVIVQDGKLVELDD
ncbi:MAG TPA: ABC transporter substrate-binding protein [Symbiobacteriaceae bacterium]